MKKIPKFIKLFTILFLFSAIFSAYKSFSMSGMDLPKDSDSQPGAKMFKANCAGCHLNGKNLIKPDKPIISSSKLKSKQTFKDFLSSPPPPMPNFKTIANNNTQFNELYSYVISLMGK